MTSEAPAKDAGSNSQTNQATDGGEGGDGGLTLEKVAAITKEQGFDLEAAIAKIATEAASKAAGEAGQKAQKTFGGQLQTLRDQLTAEREATAKVNREARIREIGAMPPEKRQAAEALFNSEEAARKVHDMHVGLMSTAKELTAERMSIDLAKAGIEVEASEFADCETPDAMVAKAATLRAEAADKKREAAELALKEAISGTGTPAPAGASPKPGERRPPAGSQAPARSVGGGTSVTAGEKAWSAFKGKGLDSLGAALKTIEPGGAAP